MRNKWRILWYICIQCMYSHVPLSVDEARLFMTELAWRMFTVSPLVSFVSLTSESLVQADDESVVMSPLFIVSSHSISDVCAYKSERPKSTGYVHTVEKPQKTSRIHVKAWNLQLLRSVGMCRQLTFAAALYCSRMRVLVQSCKLNFFQQNTDYSKNVW